jgi:ubiquinone/menaquinone biosynthesis C-methylase UbiE
MTDVDGEMRAYYDRRAAEYDEWYEGTGKFAARERHDWQVEVDLVAEALAGLDPVRTLDVACGTAFLTRHLRGEVTALDQSPAMAEIARERLPGATVVVGDALELPFEDGAFDRVLTGHFYGHLLGDDRERFLAEARRVALELVIVDSALHEGVEPEEWQERVLNDGSRHRVYKRYFTGEGLAEELGGGEVLHAGTWFVVVRSAA